MSVPESDYATPAAPLKAFVAELVAAGVRDAVVCPGSRSLALALAMRANPSLRVLTHIDERAAGFMALGLAKAGRRPVALLGTSGSAVVNFAPAVAEAYHGRVPVIVLTADRPPELRDRGAPQTIDQAHLYGRACKWYAELPVPETGELAVAHLRDTVARAVATATEVPFGPVQLNLPFRARLVPDGSLVPTNDRPVAAHTRLMTGSRSLSHADLDVLADEIARSQRPLIVVGPLDLDGAAEAITRLATSSGAAILGDALANLRCGPHDRSQVVTHADPILRSDAVRAKLRPDLVIRIGGTPTSAITLAYLEEIAAPQIVVDDGGWNEPTLLGGLMIHADPVALADALVPRLEGTAVDDRWIASWMEMDALAETAIRSALRSLDEPFEGAIFTELVGHLPDGAIVYVGSSMPVRDLDTFIPSSDTLVRYLANRGVNGIDGVVSSAVGAAAAAAGPVAVVVGDVSFLHDLNALVGTRLNELSLTIVVVDNDGGGIFSFLPQGLVERPDIGLPEHFEQLFGTPHGIDILGIARVLGAETAELTPGHMASSVAASMRRAGVRVLRLRTGRARNVELHRLVQDAVIGALP